MSFGKNPYLAKAQAAELKANDAPDPAAQARAYREAAHEWERAAGREPPGKRRSEYEQNAERNRALADGEAAAEGAEHAGAPPPAAAAPKPAVLRASKTTKPLLN
jgi:hypothetical protein